jgi:Arc/MetJ-type ribon-helix-helix transcriptional regulator
MPKTLGAGENINIRFPDPLLERIDAHVELLKSKSPGARITRSDVVRMAVEEFTAKIAKPAKSRRVEEGRG